MKFIGSKITKTIIARCERDEDLYGCLTRLVLENNIRSGCFQVIGAVKKGKLGVFENGKYEWIEHEGALEIASCTGNVAVKEGNPFIHCHAVLADPRGNVLSGHVGEGCVIDPTAEIHMQIYEGEIRRRLDPNTGLWILDI
jgi:predicted DNA-binding protein with PD1-like motif